MSISGHTSVAGGLTKSIERAFHEDFDGLQIFVSSPRSLRVTSYTQQDYDQFVKEYGRAGFTFLIQHAIYLVNLSATDDFKRQSSIESLVHYLTVGHAIGSVGTVVHTGSFSGTKSLDSAASAITTILEQTPGDQKVILENAASPSRIGQRIDDLSYIMKVVGSDRVTACLDTQHAWAGGLNLLDRETISNWVDEVGEKIGWDKVTCLHINDTKTGCGSYQDRHENIGEGMIGNTGFENFFSFKILRELPLVLETPGFGKAKGPDRENKERLAKILAS